jgi:hypothetical protein
VIQLQLNRNALSFVGQIIDFGACRYAKVIAESGTVAGTRLAASR